jgi:hypothetical protein
MKSQQVREKRAEFILLRCTFVRRASEFLTQYFPTLIDYMINDQSNFSQVLSFKQLILLIILKYKIMHAFRHN